MSPLNLLQINATVITGLLILLTVQTFSDEIRPLQDHNEWQSMITKLEVEQYALEKTLQTVHNKTSSINNIDRLNQLQETSDELSTRLVEVTYTIDKMKNTQFKIIGKNGKITTLDEELRIPSFTKIIQTYGVTMLVPFIASSMFLVAIFLEKQEKIKAIKKAFNTAKLLTLFGFGTILVSLLVFTFMIQFG